MNSEMSKNEIKKATKQFILDLFENKHNMTIIERSAGAVGYQAVRFSEDSQWNVACIYGGRGVGASIWVRDSVLTQLKGLELIKQGSHNVEDISFFKRGLDWKIDIVDFNDPIIGDIVRLSVELHQGLRDAEIESAKLKADKKAKSDARKAKMDAKRKSAW